MKMLKGRLERREHIDGYLFIAPWLAGFLIWQIGPMVFSLVMSFTNWTGIYPPEFTAFENYVEIVKDFVVWQSMKVAVLYSAMNVPLSLILGFILALLLNQGVKGSGLYRTLFYLPAVIPGIAGSYIWMWLLEPNHGIVNYLILKLLGVEGPNWLMHPSTALPSIVMVGLWAVGASMIIYLAGLQGIPTEFYEAAAIDGAGVLHKFFYITLPMMTQVLLFTLVIGIVGSFQAFQTAFIMTNGGPYYSTFFPLLYIYQLAFRNFHMGYAATFSWILFVIIMGITLLIFKSSPAWVYYEGLRRRR